MPLKKKQDHPIAYKCQDCGAMVFGAARVHAVLCAQYRKAPAMVENTHKVYTELVAEAKRPQPGKKEKYL